MIDKKVEVPKMKGLIDSINMELYRIKINLAEDNCEKTYSKMVGLMPYVNEIEKLCNDIYESESKSEGADEFI